MIRLGCCAFNFRSLSLEEALRLVSQLGFRYVDVGANGPDAQLSQSTAADRPSETGKAVRLLAEQYHLELVELFLTSLHVDGQPVEVNHPAAELRKQALQTFRQLCACAAEAGFRSVMGVPGVTQASLGRAVSWEIAVETLSQMVSIARGYGLQFNVEPHMGSLIDQPVAAKQLAQQVPGLGFTLDYAHFVGQGIKEEMLFPLHPYTTHMHAKPARPGKPKCLVQDGQVDFKGILHQLKQTDWDGVLAMECIYDLQAPTLTQHPAFQSVLLAHQLEQILNKG